MSYTSFSIGSTGRAWDGIEAGTDEWAALQATYSGDPPSTCRSSFIASIAPR
jgi:hypothetical protein